MTREQVEKEIRAILKETKEGWTKAGHKNAVQALRWWRAYWEGEQVAESYNTRDMAYFFLDGVRPLPKTIRKISFDLADDWEDEEEVLREALEDLRQFYR